MNQSGVELFFISPRLVTTETSRCLIEGWEKVSFQQRLFCINIYTCMCGASPFVHLLLPASYWKVAERYPWTDKQRGRTDPVFPPRRPVRRGQPALLDWTGAGILGVAAQHWPFTELPFSSARVKRSAGAGEWREGGCRRNEGQKAGERWGSDEGVACSCVKSAHCSFKISHFFCPPFCVLLHRCSPLPRALVLFSWVGTERYRLIS